MAKRPPAHLPTGRDGKTLSKRQRAEGIARWAEVLADATGTGRCPKCHAPLGAPHQSTCVLGQSPKDRAAATPPSDRPSVLESEWPPETKPTRRRKGKATNSSIDTSKTVESPETAQPAQPGASKDGYADPTCVCTTQPGGRHHCPVHPIEKTATAKNVRANRQDPDKQPATNRPPVAQEPVKEPPTPKPLSAKRLRFVEEYLLSMNASAAARKAGYSKKTAGEIGYELLKEPQIAAEIAQRRETLSKEKAITLDDLVRETAKMAFANVGTYHKLTGDGEPYIDLSDCSREELAALQEIQVEDVVEGRGEDARLVRKVRVKMADKRGAIALLKDLLGFGAPKKLELSGALKVEDAKTDATAARIRRMETAELKAYLELHDRMEALLKGTDDEAAA